MAVIDDGYSIYTDSDGQRQYAHGHELKMNGEIVYQMHEGSGVLKVCASPEDVQRIIGIFGPLPAKELVLPTPLRQEMHFFNVQRMESIATKDGSYLIHLGVPQVD